MGKCVSRPSSFGNHFSNTSYAAISELSYDISIYEGQTESKKKRNGAGTTGPTTKGTTMSFGYKKKNQNAKVNTTKDKGDKGKGADYKNLGHGTELTLDRNGNSNGGSLDSLHGEFIHTNALKSGHEDTGSRTRLLAPKKELSGQTCRSNRFGFRQTNTVRPASTGLQPKVTNLDQVAPTDPNNNKVKPRSKSAVTATNRISYDDNNNSNAARNYNTPGGRHTSSPKSQQQQQQQLQQRGAGRAKGNDQMVNHPTQYPKIAAPHLETNRVSSQSQNNNNGGAVQKTTTISIKLQSHTIDTQAHRTGTANSTVNKSTSDDSASSSSSSVSKFTLHTTSLPRPQYPVPISVNARYAMDSKSAKQALNNSRREFLGISNTSQQAHETNYVPYQSPRKARLRQRNLEVIMSGRHKFEVRDLEDSLSDENVAQLPLPKLPSAFQSNSSQIPLTGLVRVTDINNRPNAQTVTRLDNSPPPISNSQATLKESVEEEKLMIDNSTSEKMQKNLQIQSKNSSPGSSRASWLNAGESMAHNSISCMSIEQESKRDTQKITSSIETEEDFSAITFTNEMPISLETMPTLTLSRTVGISIEPDELEKDSHQEIENINKFCDLADKVEDILLDDETSPTNSLVSSFTESGEDNKRKEELEANIEPMDPVINLKPRTSPDTPSQNSNSLSLSEHGRDFLIDDEIADQPELVSNYKNESVSMEQQKTDNTPTLMDSGISNHNNQMKTAKPKPFDSPVNNHLSPAMRLRKMARSESLDTLSPCESIASDDLMMDFESQSSLDSIDRINRNSSAAVHSMEESQLLNELEQQGGQLFREWNNLLKFTPNQKPTNRESSITSQLPARATRLLNRSRIQSNASSDSPRSMDGIPRRSSSLNKASPSKASTEDLLMDRSVRNSMIQDILYFKKQLLRLRRLLQDDEDTLKRTETLNPFETNNGPISSSCAQILPSSADELQHQSNHNGSPHLAGGGGVGGDEVVGAGEEQLGSLLSLQSLTPSLTDDPKQELADLRRQVVFLQSQIDDKDRTIRIQKNLIAKYETERLQQLDFNGGTLVEVQNGTKADLVNAATQTERLRPISQISQDGLSRTEHNGKSTAVNQQRPNFITTVSGKIPTIYSNGNNKPPISKPVRTTYIGNILLKENNKNYGLLMGNHHNGESYSKKSLDDLLKMTENLSFKKSPSPETRRIPVPSPRNSLKNLRPSLASSTTSLSSLNHSITSSTSSLSDSNSSKSLNRSPQLNISAVVAATDSNNLINNNF